MSPGRADALLWLAFDEAARSHANSAAFLDGADSITYDRLRERAIAHADRLRAALANTGTRADDHPVVVALVAVDDRSTLEWMLAALSLEACVVLITPSDPDRDAQLRLLGPDVTISCVHGARLEIHARRARAEPLPAGITVCTAGTTGSPKAVVHTHTTLGHAIRRLQLFRLESAGTGVGRVAMNDRELADDLLEAAAAPALGLRYATTLPLTTMAGLTVAFQALLAGESLVLPSTADPSTLLDAITIAGVTNVSLTPFLAQLVMRGAIRRPNALTSHLLFVGIGGGPVVPTLPGALEAAIGCPVAVGYGTTEAGGAITMGRVSDAPEVRHHTVGRALPGIELTIDPDSQELAVRCASTALGYLTSSGAIERLDRGARSTGDLARVRPDGAIELCGRSDALILRGGRNIDPVRIEHALEDHPAVRRAAAFGVSNQVIAGEQDIWTAVVLDRTVDETELRTHCSRTLGPSLTPRRVIVVDALPLTADGAVRRHELACIADRRTPSTRMS